MPVTDYDTQLCFWDLGGQYNYRTLNELFLNEAAVILLVFDVTRIGTFENLSYWIEMVKAIVGSRSKNVLIVGNKTDVGGTAVPQEELQHFLTKYGLSRNYLETSAKERINIKELLERIGGMVEWGQLLKVDNSQKLFTAIQILKRLKKEHVIYDFSEIVNCLSKEIGDLDPLEAKSILLYYASQDRILLGQAEKYVVLDPEYASKIMGICIQVASGKIGRAHV